MSFEIGFSTFLSSEFIYLFVWRFVLTKFLVHYVATGLNTTSLLFYKIFV
jgi:hypothetical protein